MINYPNPVKFLSYTTRVGDTFDIIALDFYDEELYSGLILWYNPEYAHVVSFDSEVTIKIPVIEAGDASSLPPWKRG